MNKHSALRPGDSLLERAAEMYDYGAAMRRAPSAAQDATVIAKPAAAPEPRPEPVRRSAPPPLTRGRGVKVDREKLRDAGFIVPEAPVGALAEEFRIAKRQLLAGVKGGDGADAGKSRTILVCSAKPGEGKTFCAVNLALSLAAERDLEVLLVDGDFNKPDIFATLGAESGPGLIDAIADPNADAEDYVVQTDIAGLSILSAGRQANDVTELLASERTRLVLDGLTRNRPARIVIFDSPPALMASPASVLAGYVGQVMMVVRADQTTEADLRDAVGLLSACSSISLLLNGSGFAAGGRRFGTYYGYGQ